MKGLKDLFKEGKTLFKQIASILFEANNSETSVKQFDESTGTKHEAFTGDCKCPEMTQKLYDTPGMDYYMETKNGDKEESCDSPKKEEKEETSQKTPTNVDTGEKVMKELAGLLDELKQLRSQTTDENVVSVIDFCENRTVEIMTSCGCETIENELTFDNARHVPSPFAFIRNSCEISKTVKPGVSYRNKILVKAIVECK